MSMKCNQRRQSPARFEGCGWATSELGIRTTTPALASLPGQQDAKVTAAAATRAPRPMGP
eukprot:15437214-Alexandrium_andersonii.AAC.1